jgi:adenylate cyclase
MQQAGICKGCWQQLRVPIVLRGPFSVPFRLVGLRPSRMNPNLCTLCEMMFTRIYKVQQMSVPATILFADVRGYTALSEMLDSPQVARLLSGFYETCGTAIWDRDGIIIKLIGDAVLAVFNFPVRQEDHPYQAVMAGIDLQRRCRAMKATLQETTGGDAPLGVGVGIHTGQITIGEVGDFCRDFTAIGSVVNLASRLQGAAEPGEVLVTEEVYRQVGDHFPQTQSRRCQVKGFEQPVKAYALGVETP